MSKTDDAVQLLARSFDPALTGKERLAALLKANELRKELKVGWPKLAAPEGFNMAVHLGDLEALKAGDGDQEKPAGGDTPPAKKDRGGIGRLVNELLTETDDDYATIVAKVVARFPDAKTTARSVASVAADLRRDGVTVQTRRKGKVAAAAATV